jgi:tellurite resistance protein TehA-like permease
MKDVIAWLLIVGGVVYMIYLIFDHIRYMKEYKKEMNELTKKLDDLIVDRFTKRKT